MIEGPTPNHLIEAPVQGSGKSLLADVLLRPAIGLRLGFMAQIDRSSFSHGEEWRKRLTAIFMEMHQAIVIDNLTTTLDSGELALALTALTWEDRILGKSETISLPVRCIWVTTGNNPIMSTEIARRSIRIRLDPQADRPWQRTGFKHGDLRKWVDQHRADLVWAAHILVQVWITKGQPSATVKPLGSYENWSNTVGGILECAGIEGFLTNLDLLYEAADVEGATLREFVLEWWSRYKGRKVSVADLFDLTDDDFDLAGSNDRARRISLGKLLARHRDRVLAGYRIAYAGTVRRAAQWQLVPVPLADQSPGSPTPHLSNSEAEDAENSTATGFTDDLEIEIDSASCARVV
jgi:hypothetical protein